VSATKRAYWSKLISEQKASGQKARPFCRERGIGEYSFYKWRRRLRESEPVQFALLTSGPPAAPRQAPALELVLRNGERLRISNQVDAATLQLVLDTVRR
jgi:transposase-like protein